MKLKQILLEITKEEAAIDFLQTIIKDSPFKNRVFLAGGAVRDLEMGKSPKDLDVVVKGDINSGIDFATWMSKKLGNYKPGSSPVIFPTYGTAKFTLQGVTHNGIDLSDIDIEAVATRKEKYSDGSRKPEVSAGDLSDDVNRRDFTVNSLLKDLTTGEILDLTGKGRDDIRKGIVQTPLNPDIIFTEDPLRILRAARFAIKYDWDLPLFMVRAMKRNSSKLKNISFERIRDELNKMLMTGSPHRAIKLLKITGVLEYVVPEFKAAYKMTQNKYHTATVFQHTLDVLEKSPNRLIPRIGALFHDIGKTTTRTVVDNEVHFYTHEMVGANMTEKILRRLKYPSEIIDAVVLGVRNHMRLKSAGPEGDKISDKALRKLSVDLGSHLSDILSIMDADNRAHAPGHDMPNQINNIIKRLDTLKDSIPVKGQKSPVTGEDLKNIGLKPGPLFSEIMGFVKERQLEFPNTTKEEYISLIKNYLTSKNV